VARRQEVDEVADLRALDIGEPGEARIRRGAESEPPELIGKPPWLDPPQCLEELDERDPGGI
jgi:hypothetical protein